MNKEEAKDLVEWVRSLLMPPTEVTRDALHQLEANVEFRRLTHE